MGVAGFGDSKPTIAFRLHPHLQALGFVQALGFGLDWMLAQVFMGGRKGRHSGLFSETWPDRPGPWTPQESRSPPLAKKKKRASNASEKTIWRYLNLVTLIHWTHLPI